MPHNLPLWTDSPTSAAIGYLVIAILPLFLLDDMSTYLTMPSHPEIGVDLLA